MAVEIPQSMRNSIGTVRTVECLPRTQRHWYVCGSSRRATYTICHNGISFLQQFAFDLGFFIAIRYFTLGLFSACNLCLISYAQIFSSSPYLLNYLPHRLGMSNCPSHPSNPHPLSGVSSASAKLKPFRWHSLSTFFWGQLGSADSVQICFQGHFCCGSACESQLASCC